MNINIEIDDADAINLASVCGVREFKDGTDLITQAIANARLSAKRKTVISCIVKQDITADIIDAMLDAYGSSSGKEAALPGSPIKIAIK